MLWPVICLPVYVYVSFVSVFWSVYVCSSSSLFAFLSKSSEITFFYAMLLMLFAYVSCRLQYLQMNAVRCRAFGPRSLVLGAGCLVLEGLVLSRIRQAAVEPPQLSNRPTELTTFAKILSYPFQPSLRALKVPFCHWVLFLLLLVLPFHQLSFAFAIPTPLTGINICFRLIIFFCCLLYF